jgi:NACalpha-BTF3-like transcription factor
MQNLCGVDLAMNNYELATDYFCYLYVRTPKKFTWKAFNKFDKVKQQLLCERYNIILTDHETKGEKTKRILKKFNAKNVSKVANQIGQSVNEISKALNDMDKGLDQALGRTKRKTKYE